jgi:hypothetical protein
MRTLLSLIASSLLVVAFASAPVAGSALAGHSGHEPFATRSQISPCDQGGRLRCPELGDPYPARRRDAGNHGAVSTARGEPKVPLLKLPAR